MSVLLDLPWIDLMVRTPHDFYNTCRSHLFPMRLQIWKNSDLLPFITKNVLLKSGYGWNKYSIPKCGKRFQNLFPHAIVQQCNQQYNQQF